MAKRKLIAVHEVSHTKKGKPVAPGRTFSSESHEALVASGAARYFEESAPDPVDQGNDGEGSGEGSGEGADEGAGEGSSEGSGEGAGGEGSGDGT